MLDGSMADVGIWDQGLSEAEIVQLANNSIAALLGGGEPDVSASITNNEDGTVTLAWLGPLQSSDAVDAPYTDVVRDSPLTVTADGAARGLKSHAGPARGTAS